MSGASSKYRNEHGGDLLSHGLTKSDRQLRLPLPTEEQISGTDSRWKDRSCGGLWDDQPPSVAVRAATIPNGVARDVDVGSIGIAELQVLISKEVHTQVLEMLSPLNVDISKTKEDINRISTKLEEPTHHMDPSILQQELDTLKDCCQTLARQLHCVDIRSTLSALELSLNALTFPHLSEEDQRRTMEVLDQKQAQFKQLFNTEVPDSNPHNCLPVLTFGGSSASHASAKTPVSGLNHSPRSTEGSMKPSAYPGSTQSANSWTSKIQKALRGSV